MTRRTAAIIALIAGPLIGAALPVAQVAIECHVAPQSEACVWGKSLLPLTVAVSVVVIGAIAAFAIFAVLQWRRAGDTDADDQQGGSTP